MFIVYFQFTHDSSRQCNNGQSEFGELIQKCYYRESYINIQCEAVHASHKNVEFKYKTDKTELEQAQLEVVMFSSLSATVWGSN